MTHMPSTASVNLGVRRYVPDLPLVIWMVLFTLALGFAAGLDADEMGASFNTAFGHALGCLLYTSPSPRD